MQPSPKNDLSAEVIKSCCAALYASDWARLILGESFHPGGLNLTGHLGSQLELDSSAHLLDVACGEGASAIFLAGEYDCRVTGLDLSPDLVTRANAAAEAQNLSHWVDFYQGDAELINKQANKYDAVLCECAFCTFPDKGTAAKELFRVLRPGGLIGVSDITRSSDLPPELETLLAWVACIADAQPIDKTVQILEGAGFRIRNVEQHDQALIGLIGSIRRRLVSAELIIKLGKIDLPEIDLEEAKALARTAEDAVRERKLGYAIVVGEVPRAS